MNGTIIFLGLLLLVLVGFQIFFTIRTRLKESGEAEKLAKLSTTDDDNDENTTLMLQKVWETGFPVSGNVDSNGKLTMRVLYPDMAEIMQKDKFRSWLERQSPESIVGVSGRAECCPIATYCHERGFKDAAVTASIVIYPSLEKRTVFVTFHMPYWAKKFILEVDKLADYVEIDVKKALEILREAATV